MVTFQHIALLSRRRLLLLLPLLLLSARSLHGQSPGGVPGATLWLQTEPAGEDLQGDYRLREVAGDSVTLIFRSAHADTLVEPALFPRQHVRHFNFHPAPDLASLPVLISAALHRATLRQSMVLGVFAPREGLSADQALWRQTAAGGLGMTLTKDIAQGDGAATLLDYGHETGEDLLLSPQDSLPEPIFRAGMPRILTYGRALAPRFGVWGAPRGALLELGHARDTTVPAGAPRFTGYSPELIAYGRVLSPDERARVESYLAIKYGLTRRGNYYRSDGHLLWDAAANAPYHHRVAGLLRDPASGLNQSIATTSHEEAPRFSDQYDTWEKGSPYGQPTAKRLLVISREPGNTLPPGGYLLWGDNDGPLELATAQDQPDLQLLSRVWLCRANLPARPTLPADSLWHARGVQVEQGPLWSKLTLTAPGAGHATTRRPFPTAGGALTFTYWPQEATVTLGISEGAERGPACALGYTVTPNGEVYAVIQDQPQPLRIGEAQPGQEITIYIGIDALRIQIGSARYPAFDLPRDSVAAQHGFAKLVSPAGVGSIDRLRAGGLHPTGHTVQLGERARDLSLPTDKCFLLIDPTGSGDFTGDSVRYVPCAGRDASRGARFFRNVFFDTLSAFTFGTRDGLHAVARAIPPHCDGPLARHDGQIAITVKTGAPAYRYRLLDSAAPGNPVRQGVFFAPTHRIDSLPPGTYTLQLDGGGGINAIGHAGRSADEAHTVCKGLAPKHTLSWLVPDTAGSYEIGLVEGTHARVQHGLMIVNGAIYAVSDGERGAAPLARLAPGDRLELHRHHRDYEFRLNGRLLGQSYLAFRHTLIRLSARINYMQGTPRLYNLQAETQHSARWYHSPHVEGAGAARGEQTLRIVIPSPCALMPAGILLTQADQTIRRAGYAR